MTYVTSTTSAAETVKLAGRLATILHGGEVIELSSDLGGGKTTFVQGLALALGFKGSVTSPTFTLSQVYQLPNGLELHHYDLYRLGTVGIVGQELAEDMGHQNVITTIEWGDVAEDVLPADRLRVKIEITAEQERRWTFNSSGSVSDHLVQGLQS